MSLGTITVQAATFLEAAIASGLNVLVSGGAPAGETNDAAQSLCVAIPAQERAITCEKLHVLISGRMCRLGGRAFASSAA